MSEVSYKELSLNGLWKNNPAMVQLLGLCPLLAVSGSVVNATGLAVATTLVLVCSNSAVSLIRSIVSDAVRLPAFVMIIAAAVTCIELLMQAFAFELYEILGIFLPLITTNCVVLGRADGFASRHSLAPAAYDGLIMGAGFGLVLILLGAL
ncbi:MAG: electron transport complex subunit RsxE, partial [Halioglobus sp.]